MSHPENSRWLMFMPVVRKKKQKQKRQGLLRSRKQTDNLIYKFCVTEEMSSYKF